MRRARLGRGRAAHREGRAGVRRLQAVQVSEQPAQALAGRRAGGRAGRGVLGRRRPLACRAAATQQAVLCRAHIAAPWERQPARRAACQRAGLRPASVRLQRPRPVRGAPAWPAGLCRWRVARAPAAAWLARRASVQQTIRRPRPIPCVPCVARLRSCVRARAVLGSRRAVRGRGARLRGPPGHAACAAARAGIRGALVQPGGELAGLRGRVHQLAGGCVGARRFAVGARAQGPAQWRRWMSTTAELARRLHRQRRP